MRRLGAASASKVWSASRLIPALLLVLPAVARASTVNATTVAVSPDDTSVYAGFDGAGFSAFSRDPGTGELTFQADASTSASGGGLNSPAVLPFGSNVYGVDGQSNDLFQYAPGSAGLAEQHVYPVLSDPTIAKDPLALAVSPDGSTVYAVTYGIQYGSGIGVSTDGKISAFGRDAATGNLNLLGTTVFGSSAYVGIDPLVTPDGKFVYVAGNFPGGIAVLSRNTSTGALASVDDEGSLNAAEAIAVSPDGAFLYEAGPPSSSSSSSTAIAVLSRNAGTGRLTAVSQVSNGSGGVSGLGDIWSLAVSGDGHCVYATSRAEGSLGYFTRDATTGALTFGGVVTEGAGGVSGLAQAREVSVSPDGKNVYVASPGDNGVAVFARNSVTCAPTFLQLAQDLFSFSAPLVNEQTGGATLPVDVDAGGTLATSVQPLAGGAVTAQSRAADVIAASGPGVVNVPVAVTGAAEQELESAHQLSVQVTVTFTAAGGSPATKSTVIELVVGKPSISALRIAPATFALAGRRVRGHCVASTRSNRRDPSCRRTVSLRVTYGLSGASAVTLTVSRRTTGRTVSGRCVTATRHNRRHRACTLLVAERGEITSAGAVGANALTFNGRIGGRTLPTGSYELVLTPTGGKRVRAAFAIRS